MRLCFYGTCFLNGLFALPLSGAGLTFFAAAKKVSKESSFQTPILAMHLQTALSEWSNRGSVVSRVSSLLACRRSTGVAPQYRVDQQSYIRLRATRSPVRHNQHPSLSLSLHLRPTFVLAACFNSPPPGRPVVGHAVLRRMNDCCSTPCSGATCAPFLHANNDEPPLRTLPRLNHSVSSASEDVLGLAFESCFLCLLSLQQQRK
jgi:hypothetical protein